ncbi:MAG: type ISP restriction/modification enzyme [Bacteroides sp.]
MPLKEYLAALDAQYRTGTATEHSYRPALQQYLQAMLPGYLVTNEPMRTACGAPDYVIATRANGLPVAYVEAKDIDDPDLKGLKAHREQFDRYRGALERIVFTDYLRFYLYVHGERVLEAQVGESAGGRIRSLGEGGEREFLALVHELVGAPQRPISSPSQLAALMAGKARMLREVIGKALEQGYASTQRGTPQLGESATPHSPSDDLLYAKYLELREKLIRNLEREEFADVYAQTIVYGLFAARLHCPAGSVFERSHLADLVPATNPLLRAIFLDLIVVNPEPRIAWLVDDLVEMFAQTDTDRMLGGGAWDAGPGGGAQDPLVHFYEDFLRAYDPAKRKTRGVWYTPLPIVRFMVRAVDALLQRDFGLPQGLADSGLLPGRPQHRVQILDPATGTGTFLAEVVRQIHSTFTGREGAWPQYVGAHLLPRLFGFELLMAPYAVAHLKLETLLRQTGYTTARGPRLGIYLTNSLEGETEFQAFPGFIDHEAAGANAIKRSGRVMVMLGNPPYNVASSNQSKWIKGLVADYKRNLGERTINSLSDDYIKFIRLGQHYIERNGRGIVAYVCNNRFLDGRIFFRMREELACAFDSIYIVNLHGSTKVKESVPSGSKDENVFGITLGVCICIMVKSNTRRAGLSRVYYHDLWGRKQEKFEALGQLRLHDLQRQEISYEPPSYYFTPKDFGLRDEYEEGLKIENIFASGGKNGIETDNDPVCVCATEEMAIQLSNDAIMLNEDSFRHKYKITKEGRNWTVARAQADVRENAATLRFPGYDYRPFDRKFVIYTGRTNGILSRPVSRSYDCLLSGLNFALILCNKLSSTDFNHVFCCETLPDRCLLSNRTSETTKIFPLYTARNAGKNFFDSGDSLVPNLQPEAVARFEAIAGRKITPEELFDYIYAVLHTPGYRQRYREFLKVDFPRIPLPKDGAHFEAMAGKGGALRRLHLLQDADGWVLEATYPVAGSNAVEAVRWEGDRVYINAQQHFGHVPREVWEFYIGGYQPAQKWLKDRRGKALDYEDIERYRRIVHALVETIRIMDELERMWVESAPGANGC